MKKLVVLAALSLPVSLFADGGLPDKPYIYVEGTAEIEKPVDIVTLNFEVVVRNPDQAKANQEVQTKAKKILGMLDARQIAQNDVIAAAIKSEPQFEETDSGRKKGKLIGYTVTRQFEVKLRDVLAMPKLIDELIGVPGVEFSEVNPGVSKQKETDDEISEKAFENARERAGKMAKAMGATIDSVFAISSAPFPDIRARIFGNETPSAVTERVVVTGPPDYRLGTVTVTHSVHVIYLISPAK
jgi:uncharacterized protein YggE